MDQDMPSHLRNTCAVVKPHTKIIKFIQSLREDLAAGSSLGVWILRKNDRKPLDSAFEPSAEKMS